MRVRQVSKGKGGCGGAGANVVVVRKMVEPICGKMKEGDRRRRDRARLALARCFWAYKINLLNIKR